MNDLPQPTSAVEIIADALDEYDATYERMIEQLSAGEVAAQLLATWDKHQRMEPITESVYATLGGLLEDVLAALNAQGDRTANLAQAYERIGERLVKATREYIFSVHAMNDSDEAERLLAQRRREYQRELTRRREYE
jgi:hypothetical protein